MCSLFMFKKKKKKWPLDIAISDFKNAELKK